MARMALAGGEEGATSDPLRHRECGGAPNSFRKAGKRDLATGCRTVDASSLSNIRETCNEPTASLPRTSAGQTSGPGVPVLTIEAIREVRRHAAVSSLDAVHALFVSKGDPQAAITYLHAPHAAVKSLQVAGSHRAARLAEALIGTGIRFQCEQLDRERWRFSVAPAVLGRLLGLHAALAGPCDGAAASNRSMDPGPIDEVSKP